MRTQGLYAPELYSSVAFSKNNSLFLNIFWSKILQSVLMQPQGLRLGLYAPFTTPLFVKSYTIPYFKLAYIFSV